jgi:hypothetical protein
MSATRNILLVLVVVDAAAIGAYVLGLGSLFSENQQVSDLAVQVSSYVVTNQTLSTLQSSLGSAEKGVLQADAYFIAPDGVVGFISLIESLAKQSGLKLTIDSVDAADIDSDTKNFEERVTLRVETMGSFASTEHFLKLVESLPQSGALKLASIDKLDPVGAAIRGNAQQGQWKGEFEITALKLKQ